jgi:Cytochrome P450
MWHIVLSVVTLLFVWDLCWDFWYRRRHVPEVRRQQAPRTEAWEWPPQFRTIAYPEIWDVDGIQKTSQGCRDILTSAWRDEELADHPRQMTLLETRAGPNLRLAESFGVDNAFTTIDEVYHQDLKMKIAKTLKTSDQEWGRLWSLSKEIAHDHVARQEWKEDVLLVPFVQSVVFKVVISKLFPDNSKLDEDAAIANITTLINKIWMDSKCLPDKEPMTGALSIKGQRFLDTVARNLAALNKHLACVLPSDGWKDPRQTPLNIILPAYETLWRVVFHCIIEVLFRQVGQNNLWKDCTTKLGQTLDNEERFSLHGDTGGELSILDIVNETLRLYPPTKRIYRWEQQRNHHGALNEYPDLCAADVEAVHRDNKIWGDDALQFDPRRWSRSGVNGRKKMMDNFLPFGYGSLSCPAKGEFAPKMIGLLVVVLVRELEGRFDCVADLEEDRIDGIEPLKAKRDSYGTLKLRRLEDRVL